MNLRANFFQTDHCLSYSLHENSQAELNVVVCRHESAVSACGAIYIAVSTCSVRQMLGAHPQGFCMIRIPTSFSPWPLIDFNQSSIANFLFADLCSINPLSALGHAIVSQSICLTSLWIWRSSFKACKLVRPPYLQNQSSGWRVNGVASGELAPGGSPIPTAPRPRIVMGMPALCYMRLACAQAMQA